MQVEIEQQSCTFKPMLRHSELSLNKSLQVDYSKMNTKSIEKYIERQVNARGMKEAQEVIASKQAGSGHNWKNKVTRPITPKLSGHSKQIEIVSEEPEKQL